MEPNLRYKNVLIKLSGEALGGLQKNGIDPESLKKLGDKVAEIHRMGVLVGIVIGGGNLIRGGELIKTFPWFPHAAADHLGMLATVINGIALGEYLHAQSLPCTIFSAFEISGIVRGYNWEDMRRAIKEKNIIIFCGGTGHPFFTTDTTAALRARQMGAELLIKATKVDGVFDSDPQKNADAKLIEKISYEDVIVKNLRVMDATSIALCREANLPILVLNLHREDSLKRAVQGLDVGTLICSDPKKY